MRLFSSTLGFQQAIRGNKFKRVLAFMETRGHTTF
jgi:hypothetical protein